MEEHEKMDLGELIDGRGGAAALHRRTGLSDLTIRKIRRGERVPFVGTATRMAEGLGVDITEIDWPRGYSTGPAERHKRPSAISHDLYEAEEFKAAVAREVERQIARFAGSAAQSEPTNHK
ncbi:MAG: helix-turn-helix domain-containing protein [Actinomycetota bacterium]|nr:helix-turn-helix domain-containing protein [Actinomycetota bacterium]